MGLLCECENFGPSFPALYCILHWSQLQCPLNTQYTDTSTCQWPPRHVTVSRVATCDHSPWPRGPPPPWPAPAPRTGRGTCTLHPGRACGRGWTRLRLKVWRSDDCLPSRAVTWAGEGLGCGRRPDHGALLLGRVLMPSVGGAVLAVQLQTYPVMLYFIIAELILDALYLLLCWLTSFAVFS